MDAHLRNTSLPFLLFLEKGVNLCAFSLTFAKLLFSFGVEKKQLRNRSESLSWQFHTVKKRLHMSLAENIVIGVTYSLHPLRDSSSQSRPRSKQTPKSGATLLTPCSAAPRQIQKNKTSGEEDRSHWRGKYLQETGFVLRRDPTGKQK